MTDQQLLLQNGVPDFPAINVGQIEQAIKGVLDDNRSWLKVALETEEPKTWESLFADFERRNNILDRAWSPVSHLNAVKNTPELREVYNQLLPMLAEYGTEISQNKVLYQATQSAYQNDKTLTSAQKRALELSLESFKLSGVGLDEEKKKLFKKLEQDLSQFSADFADNILDTTNEWQWLIQDEAELDGIPTSHKDIFAQAAKDKELEGWLVTLDFPSMNAVLTYADNRVLRARVYKAYSTRASDLSDIKNHDNSELIVHILNTRLQQAKLLGFENYAQVSITQKMADSVQAVESFLKELSAKAKPVAEKEYEKMIEFAENKFQIEDVQAWDLSYISEKMRTAQFGFSDEEVKQFFPVDKVVQGLFALVERLYSIKIQAEEIDTTWHPDVRYYQVYDDGGQPIASFYLDLYARKHKRGGAWMSDYCSRMVNADGKQNPVAFMTCNATPPSKGKVARFTHDEVITLFHEFGHGLHHMLTQVDVLAVSGISGVEWDAVELPSQFMENWCWNKSVLKTMSSHETTGEELPDDLFEKMLAAKNFQAALGIQRQIEFSLIDLVLHQQTEEMDIDGVHKVVADVRSEVAVIKPPAFNRMLWSFSHIFAGGYAAGYYSYKWAEVMSADAFERFEQEGLNNPEVGKAFLKEILQVGGARPAKDSFQAFRGRAPNIDALLRHSGLESGS